MSEKDLQDLVVRLARAMGLLAYHTHDSRRSEKGFPDLVIVGERGVIFRELKTERGKVTPEQNYWLGALEMAGCNAGVWRPADWMSGFITRELRALGRSHMPKPEPTQAEIRRKLATRKK